MTIVAAKMTVKARWRKSLGFFPQELADVFRARHAVIRQFHDEGNRLAGKRASCAAASREGRPERCRTDTARHHPHRAAREEDGGEERINRQFGGAAHERREQDGHLRSRSEGRVRVAITPGTVQPETDQHQDDTSAGKADARRAYPSRRRCAPCSRCPRAGRGRRTA